jgi:hypothetical protein
MTAALSAVVSYLSFPRFAGTGTRRPSAPRGRPTAQAPGPSEAFPRRPSSLGVALYRIWAQALHIMMLVKSATLIQWHRKGFRLYWRWRSRSGHPGRPKTSRETCDLIRKMSIANPLWAAPRIHSEMLKLGIVVSQATVGRYMPWRPAVASPTWRSFLRNHMGDTVAIDMFVVATATFRLLYTVIVLGHDRQDHSLRCHPEPDPSLARKSNNRGLSVGYGTSVPAARSGSVIWPVFRDRILCDGYQGGCYCGALAVAERLRRTHQLRRFRRRGLFRSTTVPSEYLAANSPTLMTKSQP